VISELLWQPLDTKSNSSTTSKSQRWISSGEHKLCNSQENLIENHNSILPTIYISVLGPCYDFFTPTLMSILCSHVHYSFASLSRSKKVDLVYFILFFIFIFFLIYFSIFRTTRVRVDWSHCHISRNLMA